MPGEDLSSPKELITSSSVCKARQIFTKFDRDMQMRRTIKELDIRRGG